MPIINIKNLFFSINGHTILKDVNFKVFKGEFLAVIGPNGGGKTTLLRLMLGLIEPDRGDIRIFGHPPHSVANRIGYVPQNVHINQNFPISVTDVALMGRLNSGKSGKRYEKEDRAAVENALKNMDMWNYRHRRIGELSGGQRQRVFIARALVSNPEILFLDEPTASVDAKGQTELYEILKHLNQTITILLVSHDLMVLSSYIKSVACVNRKVHFHEAAEVTEEMLEMAYQCPVELIAHGLPHRVLHTHQKK